MSKMTPFQLAQKLDLPEAALTALERFEIPEDTAARLKPLFQTDFEEFEDQARKEPDADILVLALYLRWAMDTHFLYAIRGMEWDVFFDTIRDLTGACHSFTARTGNAGLDDWQWIARLIQMKIFRLDDVEFSVGTLENDLTLEGTTYCAGTDVLEIWDETASEAAICKAWGFFRMYYRRELLLLEFKKVGILRAICE